MGVEETVPAWFLDTPTLQHLYDSPPGSATPDPSAAGDHVENRSILDMLERMFNAVPILPAPVFGLVVVAAVILVIEMLAHAV